MPESNPHKTISEQLLMSFDPIEKIKVDMQVRMVLSKHPELLSILGFFENIYRVGNFISGRYFLQTEKLYLLQLELEKVKTENENLKANIK